MLQVTIVVVEKTRLKFSHQVVYPNKRRVRETMLAMDILSSAQNHTEGLTFEGLEG